MKKYTKKWAKEYLREHEDVKMIAQDENLDVLFYCEGEIEVYEYGGVWVFPIGHGLNIPPSSYNCIDKMLEYSGGWKNSKVTRGDL